MSIVDKIFGTHSERELKRIMPIVDRIESLKPQMEALSDDELRDNTRKFKERLANGETLDDILPEAFAVVREASRRVLGMRHFDVQMIGGICLHEGKIAEMRTGEGKTLVATLPVYLNALTGKGVHMVQRDSEWMGAIHRFLGLSVGLIKHDMDFPERKFAYSCDITFGTNNEYGFDYLRDNMVVDINQMVQRELNFAIVDEVDSILIDEARTPLIISGAGTKSTDMYTRMAKAVEILKAGEDYTVDEKQKTVAIPLDDARDTDGELGAELCLVETDSDHAHRSDHDDDVVGEAGEDLLLWEAACERKRRDGGHGDRGETPDIRNVARTGQNEQDQADAQVIGHCLFPS